MPRLNIDEFIGDESYRTRIAELVRQKKAGGFCVFGSTARNVALAIEELRDIDDNLLFSCDCEFGLPMRLTEGGTEFPDAMAIANTGEPELARRAASAIAKEMRAIGLGWNFAPVADVNSNSENPIINTRSFGETPETVEEYAMAFMVGLQSEDVAASAKHFPGHGDTSIDSHRELPFIDGSWERFHSLELRPFQTLITRGVQSVMTGHLAAPQLAARFGAKGKECNFPATLSPAITTGLLRNTMLFHGVIVTDSIEMHAIVKHFGDAEAASLAIQAGADIVLMPRDTLQAFDALTRAIENGIINSDAILTSAERIRAMKRRVYIDRALIDVLRLQQLVEDHTRLSDEIARKAIRTEGSLDLTDVRVIVLADERGDALKKAELFRTLLSSAISSIEIYTQNTWPRNFKMDSHTILVTFHRARGYVGGVDSRESIPALLRAADISVPIRGLLLFGNPYLDRELAVAPTFVMKTFSESRASILAAATLLKQ